MKNFMQREEQKSDGEEDLEEAAKVEAEEDEESEDSDASDKLRIGDKLFLDDVKPI